MARNEALKKLRDVLVRRRDALRRALAGDLDQLQQTADKGPGDVLDAAVDTEQHEVNSQLVEAESRELSRIDEALEKMVDGSYGSCEDCGKAIPIKRLQAVPYATECIVCRRKNEGGDTTTGRTWNRVFADAPADRV